MNERLKKLAKQAGATLEKGYIELSDGQLMLSDNVDLDKSNMDLEKFAELIVQECLLCCERTVSDPVPELVDIFEQGGIHCRDEIKQHFGVEE